MPGPDSPPDSPDQRFPVRGAVTVPIHKEPLVIAPLLETLLARESADSSALESAFHRILSGESDIAQTAGLLVALRVREPDAPMLAACARALRTHRKAVVSQVRPLVDTCGTGGDKSGTFNISTASALVVAAAGGAVAKHGNRSVSSITGSADVLEACGAPLHLEPDQASRILDATGFVFLFAPAFHPAMAHVGPARRALGIRTLFNVLGPLANPALAERQLIGVYDPALTETVARALAELGSVSALVVHCEGLDEIGLHAPTRGHALYDGEIRPVEIRTTELGLREASIEDLRGGATSQNTEILRAVLSGQDEGPKRDVVAANAGAALTVAGLAPDLESGVRTALDALASGRALRTLERYVETSVRMTGA